MHLNAYLKSLQEEKDTRMRFYSGVLGYVISRPSAFIGSDFFFPYLKGRVTEEETKKKMFQLLAHSSNGCSDWSWACLKPQLLSGGYHRHPTWMQGSKHLSHHPLESRAASIPTSNHVEYLLQTCATVLAPRIFLYYCVCVCIHMYTYIYTLQ